MRIAPQISHVGIVVLGAFNPAIFTPAWFVLHDLLPPEIESSADVQVVHQQVASFAADWLTLQATQDRFSVSTTRAPHVRLCDLVQRIFKELLPHTPLKAFGINRDVHFPVQSMAELDRIGRVLAPVQHWGVCGQNLGFDGPHGGMTSLTMSQLRPEGRQAGDKIQVTVEPSKRMSSGFGVYVGVNDHYTIGDTAASGTSAQLVKLLADTFETSLSRSEEIIDHIMSLATDPEE